MQKLKRIKDLPDDIKLLALQRQKEFKNKFDINDYVLTAFDWEKTPETRQGWYAGVINNNFEIIRAINKI